MKKVTNYWDGVKISKLIMSESDTVLKKRLEVSTPLISNQNFIKKRMLEKSTFNLFNTQSMLLIIKSDILKLKKKYIMKFSLSPVKWALLCLLIMSYQRLISVHPYQYKELFWIYCLCLLFNIISNVLYIIWYC